MRMYKIKDINTGEVLHIKTKVWDRYKHRFSYTLGFASEDKVEYKNIYQINDLVEVIINDGNSALLDTCNIQAYEQVYKPVNSGVKLKNIKTRHEQKKIMEKLKGR